MLLPKKKLVISFDAMNKLKGFNAIERTVVCEAGVVTQTLQEFARDKKLFTRLISHHGQVRLVEILPPTRVASM